MASELHSAAGAGVWSGVAEQGVRRAEREGAQEKGVSHGRAPSRARLERGVRSLAPLARSAPHSVAERVQEWAHARVSPGASESRALDSKCPPTPGKVLNGVGRALQSPAP